ADRAVERMVDEDELERRVLRLGRHLGGERRAHDHSVLRRERARGLRLRGAGLHLAEAHTAGADGWAEPRLVAEDRDLDPRGQRGLDQAGSLRHLDLDTVDRQANRVALSAHAGTSASGVSACTAEGARTPWSGDESPKGHPAWSMCAWNS